MKRLTLAILLTFSSINTPAEVLHQAVRNNNLKRVTYLIENGPPGMVNQAYSYGITPLHIAAAMNNSEMIRFLLKSGANTEARTEQGFTPVHWAASKDAVDALDTLVRAGANLSQTNRSGVTALHWASQNNATNSIKFLISLGARLDATTTSELNPLHWAVRTRAEDAALLLALEGEYRDARDASTNSLAHTEAPLPLVPKFKQVEAEGLLQVPIAKRTRIDFVWIPSLELWAGQYEITNQQFLRFKPDHKAISLVDTDLNKPTFPALSVTWNEANMYAQWLTTHYGRILPEGYVFRLPTELEWTALAQTGDPKQIYPWGNKWPPKTGNYSDLSAKKAYRHWRGLEDYDDGFPHPCPVDQAGKNRWELYGLGGNAWEWCSNWYDASKRYKVRRGASWKFDQKDALRIDKRGLDRPSARYNNIGFRLVAAPPLKPGYTDK